ncbi:MAG: hypothetical protein ACI9RU_000613 [Litorivivens sp.]|jgi:hypothetical protein
MLILTILSFSSCRKYDGLPMVELLVQDSWNSSPISHAQVGLMEDQGGFWTAELVIVETEFTDEFGTCRFDRNSFRSHVQLEHTDYSPLTILDAFDTEVAELTRFQLNPETWVRITVQDTGMANPNIESIKVEGADLYTTFYDIEDGDWRIRKPSVGQENHELSIEVLGETDYNYSIDVEFLRFDTLNLTIQY